MLHMCGSLLPSAILVDESDCALALRRLDRQTTLQWFGHGDRILHGGIWE